MIAGFKNSSRYHSRNWFGENYEEEFINKGIIRGWFRGVVVELWGKEGNRQFGRAASGGVDENG
jgi:hypothetical protein